MPTPTAPTWLSRREQYVVLACVLVGSVLRLLWPMDMEWKEDEQVMFSSAVAVVQHGVLPWVGMPSGAKLPNPGFSIWPFAFFALWVRTPVEMVQWVQWLNVAALWGWLGFAWYRTSTAFRATWLWGVALFAISPLPILFARKLWAQDLLPVLAMPFLWAHHYRRLPLGAFAWGVLGALIGQLHMSGFFFAFAVFVATVLRSSARREMRANAWLAWLAGTLCGGALMVPWLLSLLGAGHHPMDVNLKHMLTFRFFTGWLVNAWGVDLSYSLHSFFWRSFLAYPLIAGHPTYLMAAAHVLLASIALCATARWIASRFHLTDDPTLALYLTSGLIMGVLLTLSLVNVRIHYLIVLSPFLHVSAAALLRDRPKQLVAVIALQLFVSLTFLDMIHRLGGVSDGDYGPSYRSQMTLRTASILRMR